MRINITPATSGNNPQSRNISGAQNHSTNNPQRRNVDGRNISDRHAHQPNATNRTSQATQQLLRRLNHMMADSQSNSDTNIADPVDVYESSRKTDEASDVRSDIANSVIAEFSSSAARDGLVLKMMRGDDIEGIGAWIAEARARTREDGVDEDMQRFLGIHPEQIAERQAYLQENFRVIELPSPFTMAHTLFRAMSDNISRDADFEAVVELVNRLGADLENALDGLRNSHNDTLEERAMRQEAIMRSAQHIADTLMSGNAAETFMADITRQVQNDANRAQGFTVQFRWDEVQNRQLDYYTVNPFRSDTKIIRGPDGEGAFHIPNAMIFGAERLGINRDEFMDTWMNGSRFSRDSSQFDEGAWNRFVNMFREITQYVNSRNTTQADSRNFENDFNKWRSDNSNEFLENAELIRREMDATRIRFDNLIAEQRFSVLYQWQTTMQDITMQLSEFRD